MITMRKRQQITAPALHRFLFQRIQLSLRIWREYSFRTVSNKKKMQKLIFILFGLIAPNILEAQSWNVFDIGTTENLNKVYFTNDTTGFITGDNGLLFKTFDGGDTWNTITTNVLHNLQAISFANEDVGYINGLKTTDGGTTWGPQVSSDIYGFMYAYNENRIMAGHGSMFDGTIYESNDGGLSWLPHWGFGGLGMFNDCDFVNQNEGYLSSWYAGHLFKTVDAGANWSEIVIDVVDGNAWISDDYLSVASPSQDTLLVTHQNGILKTLNGGNTWSEIKPDGAISNFYPSSVIVLAMDNYLLVNRGNNPSIASPRIYETSDGGDNWTASANTVERILDVACNSSYCFAVGSNGTVYRKGNLVNINLDKIEKAELSIYPNPAKHILSVTYPKEIDEVRMYDAVGQLHHHILNDHESISISHLKTGLYFIEIHCSDGGIVTSNFMKE